MGETKGQVQVLALLLGTVTNTCNLEILLIAFRYTNNHVVDEGTGKAMERPVGFIVGRTLNSDDVAIDGYFHFLTYLAGKFTFRALYFHQVILANRYGYASGNLNWCSTNS